MGNACHFARGIYEYEVNICMHDATPGCQDKVSGIIQNLWWIKGALLGGSFRQSEMQLDH